MPLQHHLDPPRQSRSRQYRSQPYLARPYRIAGIDFLRKDTFLLIRRSFGSALWHVLPAGIVTPYAAWLLLGRPSVPTTLRGGGLPLALLVFVAAGYWQTARLRRPYVLDGATGTLSRGNRALCPPGSVRHLQVDPPAQPAGRGGLSCTYCRIRLFYATGDLDLLTRAPRHKALCLFKFDTAQQAKRVARELATFLEIPLCPEPDAAFRGASSVNHQ